MTIYCFIRGNGWLLHPLYIGGFSLGSDVFRLSWAGVAKRLKPTAEPVSCSLVLQIVFDVFSYRLPGASNCVLAAMSFATPMTKSSSGSVPVLVNELDSPIRIGIASPVRTGAVSDAVPFTVSVPLPAST